MKPRLRRVWSGEAKQWGWSVTKGWWTAWGRTVGEACKKFERLTSISQQKAQR